MFEDNSNCFACGPDNPYGLHLKVRFEGDTAVCEFVPEKKWEGYKGIMHGGITATILDEIMVYAVYKKNLWSVTADFKVRYVKSVPLGKKIIAKGWVKDMRKKLVYCESVITNEMGEVLAKGEGRYWIMKEGGLTDRI